MRVWLIKDGETLPVQPEAKRMRVWRLAEALAARGHDVTWWASTFAHLRKTSLYETDQRIEVSPGLTLRLISAGSYKRSISFARYRHHKVLARRFLELAAKEPDPDIIVSSIPINDLAYNSVKYGLSVSAKTVIDIRDPWPDVFVDKSPDWLKPIVPVALKRAYWKTAWLLSHADAWVAVSRGFEDWAVRISGGARRPSKVLYIGAQPSDVSRNAETDDHHPAPALERELEGKVLAMFVGQFSHSYDLETVIAAARLAWSEGLVGLHFLICGDGEKFDKIAGLARDLPNVSLPGWVMPGDVQQFLDRADIGLVPCQSYPNTVPNKVFECMAHGLPILSSLEGELEGLLQDSRAGLSYKVGDSEVLLGHLKALYNDKKLLETMAGNSAELFQRSFLSTRIDSEYADFIEHIGAFVARTAKDEGNSL